MTGSNARVIADDGSEAEYDRLLIATGSNPFILPIPGKDLQGVIGYRDIADTRVMMETAKPQTAVVIGGGLLGLEAANGLKLRGMDVTVVHIGDWLMERPAGQDRRHPAAERAGRPRAEVPAAQADSRTARQRRRPGLRGRVQGR
ncbi:3-phenylpropionate/cinnamic acid dioxygenase ferredoxin--NAD(+) reductase component [Stutzerimonas stutzeri]